MMWCFKPYDKLNWFYLIQNGIPFCHADLYRIKLIVIGLLITWASCSGSTCSQLLNRHAAYNLQNVLQKRSPWQEWWFNFHTMTVTFIESQIYLLLQVTKKQKLFCQMTCSLQRYVRHGCPAPVLEGQCPASFRCASAPSQLIQILQLPSQHVKTLQRPANEPTFDSGLLNHEMIKTFRILALKDCLWTPLM